MPARSRARAHEDLYETLESSRLRAMPLRFGAFTFDAKARELRRDGALIALSPKAFRLLELLIDARPNAISHEALYTELWPDVIVEPGNLHGLVSEVRSATAHDVIRTVHRVGYAFALAAIDSGSAHFSILLGDDEIPLRSGENGIGRDPRGTIVINAPDVSRNHARLIVSGAQVMLEDLGSKNGTFIGATRISESTVVRDGDDILIGTTKLRLVRVGAMRTTLTAG
jgi:DNA-binding winged helix-turn-helix (wHTH) protein